MKTKQTCPLCGFGLPTRHEFPAAMKADLGGGDRRFDWLECRECRFIFRPTGDSPDAAAYYEEDYWKSSSKAVSDVVYLERKHIFKRREFTRIWNAGLKDWFPPDGGRVMEAACFLGSWLQILKERGFKVWGIEPFLPAVEFARRMGISVWPGFYDAGSFAPASFGVIMAFHVLEHVTDPRAFAKAMRYHLKPGGTLILESPLYDPVDLGIERLKICIGDNFFNRSEARGTHEHMAIYTRETLDKLLLGSGFRVLEHVTDPVRTSKAHCALVRAEAV